MLTLGEGEKTLFEVPLLAAKRRLGEGFRVRA
jgi:hypothetical protein